mmetsp:Transcript_1705/g.1487  ORF Transcript_1705/g.1487 Transcript_1705/m.1487 type:complete len:125 (+) Transcript_1705:270-644(+)
MSAPSLGEQGRSPKFQRGPGTTRLPVPGLPSAQDLPSRRCTRPECTLVIPSQTHPDPSDAPEHRDVESPCSMLVEHPGPAVKNLKAGHNTIRPQVRIIIPADKKPDPSNHPEHCDQLSPGTLLK